MCGRLTWHEFAALCAEAVEGALDGGADLGVEAFAEVLLGNADAQAGDGLGEGGDVVGDGAIGAGGVEGVLAGEDCEHRGGVA